jgi:type IV secretory pathway TraG/TraD family ATPase VirD4
MIYLADLTALLLTVAILRWCFLPHSQLPRFRVRYLRLRLRLRLHPGRGHASVAELWLRWGRLAAFRRSRRSRPSLPAWARMLIPDLHSLLLGRAQYGHGLRVGLEEHVLVMVPPRTGKTGLLARIVLRYRGPVVATTTKADVFELTSGIRSLRGRVEVFNPQGIGGVPSTFQWDPVQGCADEATAIRRADGFASAVGMSGTEDASFWVGKASSYLRALLHAAALAGGDMRMVAGWALGSAHEAEQILADAGAGQWALELSELRGEAYKTAATVRMVMTRALSFMTDPALARAVLPGGGRFEIEGFLRGSGTLYLIAASDHDDSPVAPLFAAMAGEIHHVAAQLGQASPGQRLDPPLLFALDEIVQTCPVPLPAWLADSGGKGIQLIPVTHGEAQLRTRWGSDGAQVVLDTCGVKVWLPGITDTATLKMAGELCGQASFTERVRYRGWVRSEERRVWHDVLTPDMIRQLPSGHALILRGGYTPVIARLGAAWRDPAYRAACRRGVTRAPLTLAGEAMVLADAGPAWPQPPGLRPGQPPPGFDVDPEAAGGFAEIPDYPEDLPW